MVKNCVKVNNIFYFMLFTGVSDYVFKMFCISVGMALFIGNATLKFYLRQVAMTQVISDKWWDNFKEEVFFGTVKQFLAM